MNRITLQVCLFVAAVSGGAALAADGSSEPASEGAKELSGMSILGNSEAPKSLVIVPWKTSEIGDGIGVANALDGRIQPLDKEVFVRELDYYELRTGRSTDTALENENSLARH